LDIIVEKRTQGDIVMVGENDYKLTGVVNSITTNTLQYKTYQ